MRTHSERRQSNLKQYIGAALAISTLAAIGIAVGPAAAGSTASTETTTSSTGPRLLHDQFGDLVVRLVGNVCTGAPIAGTVYVVTAAHCVLTKTGDVTQRTVVRDHVRYSAVAVLVDSRYHDHPSEALDAAVLVMAQAIPGPAVRVGAALPDSGSVTLAGFQPLDADGRPLGRPAGAKSVLPYGPAGCTEPVDELDVSAVRVVVPCGLVPGASGGGLFVEHDGEVDLVGILSTVTSDQRANGVVPLSSLQELLAHPDRYSHGFHPAVPRSADDAERTWGGAAPSSGADPARGEPDDSYFARTGQHLPIG